MYLICGNLLQFQSRHFLTFLKCAYLHYKRIFMSVTWFWDIFFYLLWRGNIIIMNIMRVILNQWTELCSGKAGLVHGAWLILCTIGSNLSISFPKNKTIELYCATVRDLENLRMLMCNFCSQNLNFCPIYILKSHLKVLSGNILRQCAE